MVLKWFVFLILSLCTFYTSSVRMRSSVQFFWLQSILTAASFFDYDDVNSGTALLHGRLPVKRQEEPIFTNKTIRTTYINRQEVCSCVLNSLQYTFCLTSPVAGGVPSLPLHCTSHFASRLRGFCSPFEFACPPPFHSLLPSTMKSLVLS
jgi:hypothetical protein